MLNRRGFLGALAAGAAAGQVSTFAENQAATPRGETMSKSYQVAVYYFPNYHVDARNVERHGAGWSEWELVKYARPRYEGHYQPKVPAWGYTDEADPVDMAQKIDAAADHGVDAFIFDWYYYDDGPFLQRGLEEGFFGAKNNDRLKFSLMWANHDWTDIHPAKRKATRDLQYPGKITPATWDSMTDMIVDRYFKHPSHWLIEGKPYFSVYDLSMLIASFGSVGATRVALDAFRKKAQAAGFPDINLNAVVWGRTILPDEKEIPDPADVVERLGFNSVSSYVWIHHVALKDFPLTDYDYVMEEYLKYAARARDMFEVPYYPNATMGWDSSARVCPSDVLDGLGYPNMAGIGGNTPEAFAEGLRQIKAFLADAPKDQRILSINAWNEWTEGSYLEPDMKQGMGYLEAIRDVFGA